MANFLRTIFPKKLVPLLPPAPTAQHLKVSFSIFFPELPYNLEAIFLATPPPEHTRKHSFLQWTPPACRALCWGPTADCARGHTGTQVRMRALGCTPVVRHLPSPPRNPQQCVKHHRARTSSFSDPFGAGLQMVDVGAPWKLGCRLQVTLPVRIVNTALADALAPTLPTTGSKAQAMLGSHPLVKNRVSRMPTGHVSSGGSCSQGLKPWSPPVAWHDGHVPSWLWKASSEQEGTLHSVSTPSLSLVALHLYLYSR